jgi:hypothetical protein
VLIWGPLGPVAQLVARLVRNEEVTGSIPVRSTETKAVVDRLRGMRFGRPRIEHWGVFARLASSEVHSL